MAESSKTNAFRVIGPGQFVRGMFSAREMSLLGDGEFQQIKNLRCDSGLPRARKRDVSVITKPSWATTAVPLGKTEALVNGTNYVVAVFSDGSKARVAVCPPSLDRWVEVTGTGQWTGPSGNNRMDNIASDVYFTVIKTPRARTTSGTFASRDVVLIQNGQDIPRLWDPDSQNYTSANVSAAVGSGGRIRLTIGSHNYQTGDHAYVQNVGGVPAATGLWQVTRISGTVIELDNSTFAGTYTSGGTVFDRVDLLVHKPIEDISSKGQSYATCQAFWPIRGGTGTTFYASGAVNSAAFNFADSTAVPYDGTNSNITWTVTSGVALNDIAAVYFASSAMVIGRQVVMLIEGEYALGHLKQSKIEVNRENVAYNSINTGTNPWQVLYDPSGATDAQRSEFYTVVQDSASNRWWIIFDAGQLEGTGVYHMRFTRQLTSAPGSTQTMSICFIGSPSGDIPSSTVWAYGYEDEANKVEARRHLMNAESDSIGLLGGNQFVRNGVATVTTEAPGFPQTDGIVADWRFNVANSNDTGATEIINGGLDSVPDKVNIYCKLPGQDTFYFMVATTMFTRGFSGSTRAWSNTDANLILDIDFPANVAQSLVNYNREAPSDFHVPIPIARAIKYNYGRLLCGGILDSTTQYGYSDGYFSWERNPFRFQQVQEDEQRGGYFQMAGERIQAFEGSASAALGAGRIFVYTDKGIYTLGDAGPFSGASIGASALAKYQMIGPHGTLSPRSICQGYNALFWVDQNLQVIRLGSGGLQNISQNQVADRFESSVVSRTSRISSAFRKDRVYMAFTPYLESLNERVLVWNERMQAWESEDYETSSTNFELLGTYDAATGTMNYSRLFFFDTAGTMFAYEESSSSTVDIAIWTREYQFKGWDEWYVGEIATEATVNAATNLTNNRNSRTWGIDEPWVTTTSLANSGADFAKAKDNYVPTKTGAARGTMADFGWNILLTGTVAPDTVLLRYEFVGCGSAASSPGR